MNSLDFDKKKQNSLVLVTLQELSAELHLKCLGGVSALFQIEILNNLSKK